MSTINLRIADDVLARLRAAATERSTTVTALLLDPWRKGGDELVYVPSPDPKGREVFSVAPLHLGSVGVVAVLNTSKARTIAEPETLGHHGPKARDKVPKPVQALQPKSWDGSPIERKTASPKKG